MTDPTGSEAWERGVARARLLLAQADPEVVDLVETDPPSTGPARDVDLGPYDASAVDFTTTPPVVAARQLLARIRAQRAADHPDPDVRQEARPMTLTSTGSAEVRHPAQYSPEVVEVLAELIRPGDHVHDPFAGTGLRLGRLCDRIGATFTGADIERWPGRDPRVAVGDALDPASYPTGPHLIVTSPVYVNKRLADYPNGPTLTTKTKGRRDYAIALGAPLHPDNLARTTGRPARAADYWRLHHQAATHWPERVAVNVDGPISHDWCDLLEDVGYGIVRVHLVRTQRYGGLANADKRADREAVIVAARSSTA